jgi:cell division protein FtsL
MARVNLILLFIAIACALGAVTSQHHARKLFVALEREQERTKQLDIEFGQLQLEVSTWAMHARIEKIAATKLNMRTPAPNRVQVLVARDEEARR